MHYSSTDSPESILKVFAEAWNKRDAGKIASLFDDDAEFINVTGLWWHKREDIERAHDYGLRTIFSHSKLSILQTRVKYLSEAIAVVQAKMKLTGQRPAAGVAAPGERKTIFTFVVHRQGERWSCASAHNTDIVANMESHIRDEKGNLIAVDYRKERGTPE